MAALAHLLVGTVEARAPARLLKGDALQPDLLQQHDRFGSAAGVDLLLDLVVGGPAGALHLRPFHGHRRDVRAGVQLECPDEGAAHLVRQQGRRTLAEHDGVQRDAAIGRVHRLPALAGLGIDRAAGRHEGGNVGDRVPGLVARAVPGEMQRLVEIGRTLRVDGDEGDVGRIGRRKHDSRGHPLRLRLDFGGELGHELQLRAKRSKRRRELAFG